VETIKRVRKISAKIAQGLKISGPFNIQYISKDNDIKVIECNLRASRYVVAHFEAVIGSDLLLTGDRCSISCDN